MYVEMVRRGKEAVAVGEKDEGGLEGGGGMDQLSQFQIGRAHV